jgi:hypothetical protein
MVTLASVPWRQWVPGTSVIGAFRRDRLLGIAFLVLSLGALMPIFATPLFPFPDLATNIANGSLLVRTALGQAGTEFYRVDWFPLPYWTTYLFTGFVNLLAGPFVAAKALTAILVILMPLGVMRLLLAMERDPRLSLWAFLFSWDHNLYAGWHAYVAGMALSLIVLARALEATDGTRAARVIPWSACLAITHALAVLFAWVAAFLLALPVPDRARRLKLHAIALSGTGLIVVPWIAARLAAFRAAGPNAPLAFDFPSAATRASGVFGFSLDVLQGPWGESTAAVAFALLIVGPLALGCVAGATSESHRWSGLMMVVAALALYASLPMSILGPIDHWYTYPRYATYILAGMLLAPPLRRVPLPLLLPGAVVALANNVVTTARFHAFGERVRPFLEIAEQVPAGSRLLPLEYVDGDPVAKFAPLAHLHSYITGKGGYDPHLFDYPSAPIRYRPALSIPRIPWLGPQGFTLARYGPHYDYILVQGSDQDPFIQRPADGGYRVHLQREAGIWRLYRVERDSEAQ